MNFTFATLLSTPSYLPGVKVLYRSLKKYGRTKYPFVCVCSMELPEYAFKYLNKWKIPYLKLEHKALDLIEFPKQNVEYAHWNYTFDKLLLWELEEYDKIVFLDSDMMVVSPIDELFEKLDMSAVAAGKFMFPEWIELNSGLMVFEPQKDIARKLLSLIKPTIEEFSKEGKSVSDQDVLNNFRKDWPQCTHLHLGEEYNVFYSFLQDYHKQQLPPPKIIHFVGGIKPWNVMPVKQRLRYILQVFRHKRDCFSPYLKYMRLLYL